MTLRLLAFCVPCLLLLCCNRQGNAHVRKNEQNLKVSSLRSKRPDRTQTEEKPTAQRTRLETIDHIESPEMREKVLAETTWNAIETDPALAHEAFQKLAAGCPEKIRLIQYYALRLAEQSIEEALLWSEALDTEQEIAAAKYKVALVIAETDPRLAASMLSECGIAGRDFDVAVVQVVQRWACKSAQDAAAWVSMFPAGPAREAGFQAVAQQWLVRNPAAVFGWLEGTTDGALRKETAKAIASAIGQQPPQTEKDWLNQASPSVLAELRIREE